jgi:chaperonin cofactor prefoldin
MEERRTLSSRVASLSSEAEASSTQVSELKAERDALSAQVAQVATERDQLSSRVAELSTERETLSGRVGILTSQRETYSTRLAELAAEREGLVAQVGKLTAERDGYSSLLAKLTAEREALTAQLAERSAIATTNGAVQIPVQQAAAAELAANGVTSGHEAPTEPAAADGSVVATDPADPTAPVEESQEFALDTIDLATRWKELTEEFDLTGVQTWLGDNLNKLSLDRKTAQMKGPPTDPAVVAGDQALIQLYQKALKNAGFNPGPIDGQLGPRTGKALTSYQTAVGLAPSGAFDQATLETLSRQHRGPAEVKLARAVYVSTEDAGKTSYKGLLAALVGLLAITLWLSGWRLLFRRRPA